MRTKSSSVFMLTSQMDFDVFVFVETWLNGDFYDGEFFNTDIYNVFRKDRDSFKTGLSRGGGVLIAVNRNLKPMLVQLPNSDSLLDQLCVRITGSAGFLFIFASYIPPNSKVDLYNAHVQNIIELCPQNDVDACIILGDFNLNNLIWSNSNFCNYLYANNVNKEYEINFIDALSGLDLVQINSYANDLNSSPGLHHVTLSIKLEFYYFPKANDVTDKLDFNHCNFDLLNELISRISWIDLFYGKSLQDCFNIFVQHINSICFANIPRLRPKYVLSFERRICDNPKSFWNYINSKKSSSDYPSVMFLGDKRAVTPKDQVDLFADYFFSNFQCINDGIDESVLNSVNHIIDWGHLAICESDVISGLSDLSENTKPDNDGLCSLLLKKCSTMQQYIVVVVKCSEQTGLLEEK
ncbi:uncharacterized protein LOC142235963 [Haematobia irritans]|uniref:uncharacterized protein LOC142235963 n=1 Tax=Haematobia irritans TaxID=7368 RepID=UPI003F50AD15